MSGSGKGNRQRLQWHPAFGAALRITFAEEIERKELELQEEYLLSKKPPDDNLSVNDFYKVYGYACFYQSNTNRGREIEPTEITITFVCNHYPREMMKHLKEGRGIRAECHYKGVYYLKGDAIPMQLLITHELTQEENCWIQSLRMNLRAGKELSGLITRYEPFKDSKDHAAVMDLITRANWKEMEVEEKMCDALRELFADEMEKEREKARRTGRQEGLEEGHAQGRAQGLEQGLELAKLIFRLSSEGRSEEEIAGKCGIPLERVREVLE